ncbi:foldase [Peptoniphilus sp. AGMB00490]|uniref:peptidylprolyl isomerase n=1 Tax=Peptoniphilus faecalis TaxID=2731255 RepID=A0A848R9F0_9FIRM|nr:peptidylprolyl isomerase [Peptoniphilus faecalis]NMW85947.1 foldase [Peptoniphilus faecalis]
MNFKKLGKIAVAITLASSLVACGAKKGVAANVGGVDIPMEAYYKSYAARVNQLTSMYGEEILKNKEDGQKSTDELLREQAITDLTTTEALKQDAEKSKITVSDDEVNEKINEIETQLGGKEAFDTFLKQNGLPRDYVAENMKNQMLVGKWTQEKTKELTPSDDEVKKYYEDNKDKYFKAKASHILVNDLKEANVLRKQILKGEDFAKVAKENSKDTGSAKNGGSLGEFTSGQMVKEFDEEIAKMKAGDISEPIKTQFGYHIIKLDEKTPLEFDAVKDQVKATLQQEKFKEYVDKVKKDAKIKVYVNTKKEVELPDEFKNFGKIEKEENSKANSAENTKTNADNKTTGKENAKAENKTVEKENAKVENKTK